MTSKAYDTSYIKAMEEIYYNHYISCSVILTAYLVLFIILIFWKKLSRYNYKDITLLKVWFYKHTCIKNLHCRYLVFRLQNIVTALKIWSLWYILAKYVLCSRNSFYLAKSYVILIVLMLKFVSFNIKSKK